ncbi:hexosaminidase D [Hyla sarda]|uniref:hexosaminidase D n=1 Tax=Hyla sarda TaxID=327740 RepID=UPI0024C25F5A|nr:hexosaminidase D [Hyla sarda]XP_056406472.1 hexosaminidase D [Hyla sarda]
METRAAGDMDGQNSDSKNCAYTTEKSASANMILVHLDLKGAPPKVSYLAEVFPLFSALGANGLLIEYEDTFPYYEELLPLRAAHAYSPQEIQEILMLAQVNRLEVIPLIQTFGHMEFVLKHKEFAHLREVPTYPNSLNPHREESHQLLHGMIRQMMEHHPGIRWLHIGSDEVYYLGEGEESKKILSENGWAVEDLFMCHLKKVAAHVVSTYPGVRPIAWDDMLRPASAQTLTDSGLAQLVEPMIWDYTPNLDVDNRVALIEKYSQSGFQKIWLASAFKGATGASQQLTHIGHHLQNHKRWLQVIRRIPQDTLQGVAITGWQRYDHFSVLCELLPVGIPSLAVCLQMLKHGSYSEQVAACIQDILGMSHLDTENYSSEASGSFPGSDVLILITQVLFHLKTPTQEFLERNRFVSGWFSPFHRKRKMIHPIMVQQIEPEAVSLLSNWALVLGDLHAALLKIFPAVTVDEWMEEYSMPYYVQLQELVEDLNTALENQT